ncbi:unnamed protein product [Didymodactylos carnosus]|uniref:Coiled-coil domain-containing protein 12 n=1 Tax=Didymodactylos carnosus TaxID=1234261 RepID=A0A814G977_9BILA|nr:unnamed protein product [Didymodactylos carnosus]CAF1105265.1 unnamed protein product [Didymodactylos carnosus]CAF3763027.1 unnamed protein product [Didymodactylos carnosus]CAF3868292.1 unnamed protein product [Didymodactylos carnosus]
MLLADIESCQLQEEARRRKERLEQWKKKKILKRIDEHINLGSGESDVPPPIDDVDLTTLAPRKPDWDLKRDVEKKLKRLEKRTTRATAELTRERLLTEQKGLNATVNFAEIVSTISRFNQHQEDDED